jgi:hypothetical protein
MIASYRESGQKTYVLKASYLIIHPWRQSDLATEIEVGTR